MFRKRPPRLTSFDYVGRCRYFLTICTDFRRPYFISHSIVDATVVQIRRAAGDEKFALVAYCFMPDHLHLLIEGTADDADFKRFLARAKQLSAYAFSRAHGRRLWQEGGFERVFRGEESTIAVARYILENPIRAGLAAAIEEYPFSGSDVYSMRQFAEMLQGNSGRWQPEWQG